MRALRNRGGAADDRGFTIAELVTAIAILFVIVVAVMGALSFASASAQGTARRETALNLANQRVEQARNLAYDEMGVVGGDPPGTIPASQRVGDYTIDTSVAWVRDSSTGRATYKRVIVDVSWTGATEQHVAVETAIYGKSDLINTGDVEVTCVLKGTSTPIAGATVVLATESGDRTATSDSTGKAFFGFVPAGNASISVTKDGYVWDLQQVQTLTIIPDILSPYTLEGYPGATVNVHVVDGSGNPISGASAKITQTLQTATTGSDGFVALDELKVGSYTIQVTATGRPTAIQAFEVATAGETVEVTVQMADAQTLRVRVLGTSATPLAGASVALTDPGGGAAPGSPQTSGSDGVAGFTLTAAGTYTIAVTATGYQAATQSVSVDPASPQDVTVQLAPIATATGGLDITLRYTNGTIAAGRRVHVWCSNPVYDRYYITDSYGRVAVRDLMPGLYWVQPVGLTSYLARGNAVSAQVGAGQVVAINVTRTL